MVSLEILDNLPSKKELRAIQNPIASELFSDDDRLIGKYFKENRQKLTFEDLNEHFINALIATEDIRFYDHNGIDRRSLVRVLIKSILLQKKRSGGGSTITQQLVKNLYPRKNYSALGMVINKFREMSIAKRIEKVLTKDQILVLYANTVSFGERAFGLTTASYRFFNKTPDQLDLNEAATLVGLLKATSYYSPRKHPERSTQRRNIVLSQMLKYGFLDQETFLSASSDPIELNYNSISEEQELAKYFKQQLKSEFDAWAIQNPKNDGSVYNLEQDGLKVYSTINYDLQIAAENIFSKHIKKLQSIFDQSWKGGQKFGKSTKIIDDKILSDPFYKSLRKNGSNAKDALTAFTTKGSRKVWSHDGMINLEGTKIDSIKHYLSVVHGGLTGIHPQTGEIKVWVGGNDYSHFQWDNVISSRQVGSTFKPIVYLTALDKGVESCDYFKNELRTYSDYQDWTPKNADHKYGGYVSTAGGLTHSINTISVQMMFKAGPNHVAQTAQQLGIKSPLNKVPSLVLGTSDISLLEMVHAYAHFQKKDAVTTPYSISKIENRDGEVLYTSQQNSGHNDLTISADNFETIDNLLIKVNQEGTGRRLYQNYDVPKGIRGKTGTTQNQSDGWYIAYTENLVLGAWVGLQDRRMHFRNLGTGSGSRTALPIVGGVLEYASNAGKLNTRTPDINEFPSCPDSLSSEQYMQWKNRQKGEKIGEIAESIIDLIFKNKEKRKRSKKKNRKRKEKEERIRDVQKSIKEWEEKLRKLKEELEKDD